MSKKLALFGLGAFVVGTMYTIGLIILIQTPDRFVIPTPHMAVAGGALVMFATLLGFAMGFIQTALVKE